MDKYEFIRPYQKMRVNNLSSKTTKWAKTLKHFLGYCRRIVWVCLTILWDWRLKGWINRNSYISYTISWCHSTIYCVKNVRIWKISGPYFPAFGLNTERYSVSLRIQSECWKTQTRKTSNRDTFNAVIAELNWIESLYFMLTKNTCSISRWVWNTKRKKSFIRVVMKVTSLDTRHGLCLPQTFRGSEELSLNVFCTFNLGPVSSGNKKYI